MTTETNQKNNMKLPPHLRQWVIQQMVAINLQVLPAELANEFLESLKEREESGFAEELVSCLSEAEKITVPSAEEVGLPTSTSALPNQSPRAKRT
jgi:hypothetical protein